jgi:hypothetical protein
MNKHNHTAADDMRISVRRWLPYITIERRRHKESERDDTYLWRGYGSSNKFFQIKGTTGWITGH